ncbi:hypothetical protein ACH5RR_016457 [Cinchona calisaya]|uniref:Uncharacterized protein n=1 Tax=Cinchona calisaya TaxID=153742 RepID=A0ABD3A1J8_9GENT
MEGANSMAMNNNSANYSTPLRIVMFPWLAYGHISPFLELAKKLITHRGIHIYLCSTPINLKFISKKLITANKELYSPSKIELVEYNLPNLPELPPHYHTTNGLPIHLNSTLIKALKMSESQLHNIINSLRPNLVIFDAFLTSLSISPSKLQIKNILSLLFCIYSAAFLSYASHSVLNPRSDYPFPDIYYREFEQLDKNNDNMNDYDHVKMPNALPMLVNTSRVGREINKEGDIELINWLDQKSGYSTVFASFGSEYFLTDEEIEEIAFGLELSNVNFIWALSVEFGVPIIAMPMNYEQPLNARVMVENGVAVEIVRDECGKLERGEIAKVIRDMVLGGLGIPMRQKMKDFSKNMKLSEKEDLEGLVRMIVQLSNKCSKFYC